MLPNAWKSRLTGAALLTAGGSAEAFAAEQTAMPVADSPALAATTTAGADLRQPEAVLIDLWQAFEAGMHLGMEGISRLPELPRQFADRWQQESGGAGIGEYLLSLGLILATAAIAGWGVQWLLARFLHRRSAAGAAAPGIPPDDLLARLVFCLRRLTADVAGLVVFAVLAVQLGRASLPGSSFMLLAGRDVLRGILVIALFVIAARFLLSPAGGNRSRLLPIPRPRWHLAMWLTYGALGVLNGTIVFLATRAGSDPLVIEGWFLLMAAVVTIQKCWWFWAGRRDIAAAICQDDLTGWWRRVVGHSLPGLLVFIAVAMAIAAVLTATNPAAISWGSAAGASQLIAILLPIAAFGCDAVIRAYFARRHFAEPPTPLRASLAVVIRQIATGIVWVVGLFAFGRLWRFLLQDIGVADGFSALPQVAAAVITGCVIWSFLRAYFNAYMPQRGTGQLADEDEDGERRVLGRLASVLPVVRDLAYGGVIAITVLAMLAAVGVDIAPLLAGFGVVGLAISFGSQALVKDIVSGFFFMADDAFRVGEYIDTGKLKGTVEKISLRSVRLRHQSGQVHTIPFGTLDAITNFSRDWATIKFAIRVDRDSDLEKVRKVIKKVGQQMMETPELAQEFIMPLKLQGMQELTETTLVLRCKFTCRPAKPSYLQRESLKRIYAALRQEGIALPSNAVTVRSNAASDVDAAATRALKMPAEAPEAAS